MSHILKPEFIFRPAQILRRLRWKSHWKDQIGTVELPWGLPLEIDARETIGMAITKNGIYDLIVPEAILRLCDQGETALDIGANIGMTLGAMALAVGNQGKVIAFEPHPTLHARLVQTISNWSHTHKVEYSGNKNHATANWIDFPNVTNIELRAEAVSDDSSNIEKLKVPTITLDEALANPEDKIGVLKIDIGGHEHAALRGAERLLSVGCIRDIIFKEHEPLPTELSRLLKNHGYKIFLIRKDTLRPRLIPTPCEGSPPMSNYLATLNPKRASTRFTTRGFLSLKKHPTQR